jgi:hypothetical protein
MCNGATLELDFEERLMNWGATVRGSVGSAGGACALWADLYVKHRNDQEKALAIALQIALPASPLRATDSNVLDGWLIEAAWTRLGFFDQKEALKLRYVWGYRNQFIKNKLHINGSCLDIVLGRAKTNLKLVLDKLDSPAKIRANNLHARYVPRP